MLLLTNEELDELQSRALEDGLMDRRNELLARLHPLFVAGLRTDQTPMGQLILDLAALNRAPRIIGDVTPLVLWLLMAKSLTSAYPDRQGFYADLAETVAQRARAAAPAMPAAAAPGDRPAVTDNIPEKIIYKNDLVAAAFVTGAERTARSVARIVVPQIERGRARTNPSSGEAVVAYGTCWLIGPRHVITNWHVVEARAPGEAAPSEDDIRRQCAGSRIEFDFDYQDAPIVSLAVEALVQGDPTLDYALLRLAGDPARPALPVRNEPLTVDPAAPFPVNVVQHPGGAPKQFGIRNNLVAALNGNDLAYFTDTAGGSSGSPVCDDQWRVLALHKASSLKFGVQNFQGKTTAWVNVGTPIRLILDHLGSLRTEIGVTIA